MLDKLKFALSQKETYIYCSIYLISSMVYLHLIQYLFDPNRFIVILCGVAFYLLFERLSSKIPYLVNLNLKSSYDEKKRIIDIKREGYGEYTTKYLISNPDADLFYMSLSDEYILWMKKGRLPYDYIFSTKENIEKFIINDLCKDKFREDRLKKILSK